jgi:hypothetical protein
LADDGPEPGHALCQPCWNAPAMERKISRAGTPRHRLTRYQLAGDNQDFAFAASAPRHARSGATNFPKFGADNAGKGSGETRTYALLSQPETGKISCVHHLPCARLTPGV